MGEEQPGPPEPRLTVAAVARRLGVAPATLRTWDRRYGLGPTLHEPGAHRRYSVTDLARLETMRRLVLDGVPPAESARLVHAQVPLRPPLGLVPDVPDAAAGTAVDDPAGRDPSGQDGPGPDSGHSNDSRRNGPGREGVGGPSGLQPDIASYATGPGGRILAVPGADPAVRGLARAAMSLDAPAARGALEHSLREHGVVRTWETLLRPVLAAAGARWAATGEGIEVEHVLAETAIGVFRSAGHAPEPPNGRPVLLACAPGEQHSLPLSVLAAALAEQGVGTRILGGALPAPALAAAVRRTGPSVLVLWAQLADYADTAVLDAVPRLRPPVTLLAAGTGWADRHLPQRVSYVADLAAAVGTVRHIVG